MCQFRTGARRHQGKRLGAALPLLLALTTGAAARPAAAWPEFLEPRDALPSDVIAAVERVWHEPTISRTVRGRPARVPFAVHAVFVDTPEVTAAAARVRGLARYEVEPLGEDRYLADDGDGARGRYQVLRREPKRRVILSWGEHTGRLLGTIHGSALTVLDFEPLDDRVEQELTAYVRIENGFAAAVARVLIALFGFVADRKLAEGLRVTARVVEWAVERPDEFCAWLAREPLAEERRARILAALPSCAGAPAGDRAPS